MEIYDWIYANATLPGDAGDYRIRLCGEGLWDYTDFLVRLSIRLLSVNMRTGPDKPISWFAGRLEDSLYLVAAGGTQSAILGPDYPLLGGYRQQFCVLGYGFSGGPEEFALYSEQIRNRDITMFTPLRTYLWELSNGQQPARWEGPWNRRDRVQHSPHGVLSGRGPNLFASSSEQNNLLWAEWRTRPVALDILSVSDAHKMIALVPGLAVTTLEDVIDSFYAPPPPAAMTSLQLKELVKSVEDEQQKTGQSALHSEAGTQDKRPQTAAAGKGLFAWFFSEGQKEGQKSSDPAEKRKARLKRISDTVEVCKTRLDPGRTAIAKEYEKRLQDRVPPEKAYLAELLKKWVWLALTAAPRDREEKRLRMILDQVIARNTRQERKAKNPYEMDEYQERLLRDCENLMKEVQKS